MLGICPNLTPGTTLKGCLVEKEQTNKHRLFFFPSNTIFETSKSELTV